MYQIEDHGPAFIVLSSGRTGSILLSKNIEKNFRTHLADREIAIPTVAVVKSHNELVTVPGPLSIVHSHLNFSSQKLLNYTRVFSVRRNVTEQLISHILVKQFNRYHVMTWESTVDFEPFEVDDWQLVESVCKNYVQWHSFYASTLTGNDLVVVYETFADKLIPGQEQQKIYPNKDSIITNYQQVVDFINDQIKDQSDLDKFLQHTNPFDIYKYVTQ